MQKTPQAQVKKLTDEIPISRISILVRDGKSGQRQVQTRFSREWNLNIHHSFFATSHQPATVDKGTCRYFPRGATESS